MGGDLDKWIEQLKRCEPISESDVKVLCHLALDVLVEESNVQQVSAPVTVCACPFFLCSPPSYACLRMFQSASWLQWLHSS